MLLFCMSEQNTQMFDHDHDRNDYMQRIVLLAKAASDKVIPYTPLKPPVNRGLVRSALQKNIRRGRYNDAVRMAAHMKGPTPKENAYLWFSLQVCGIEDVGYGDLETLGLTLYASLLGT